MASDEASQDPLAVLDEQISRLTEELKKHKAVRLRISQERKKWPKLVRVQVGGGKWYEPFVEAFGHTCGWVAGEDNNLGPCGNGKYLGAQAWLVFEAKENGDVTLVGAECQSFGSIGRVS